MPLVTFHEETYIVIATVSPKDPEKSKLGSKLCGEPVLSAMATLLEHSDVHPLAATIEFE